MIMNEVRARSCNEDDRPSGPGVLAVGPSTTPANLVRGRDSGLSPGYTSRRQRSHTDRRAPAPARADAPMGKASAHNPWASTAADPLDGCRGVVDGCSRHRALRQVENASQFRHLTIEATIQL